jgi:hypothetical protein
MAATEMAPVDELTGIPFVLIPYLGGKTDLNHAFFPGADVRSKGLAGQALRNCRTQVVDYDVHHDGFHREFWGTPLPATKQQEIATVVLAAAGVIPELALDYADLAKSKIVRLDEKTRLKMWKTNNVRVQSAEIVRAYLLDVLVREDNFRDVKPATIDEFLVTKDPEIKLQRAYSLLGSAAQTVAYGIEPVYRQAWNKRLMPPNLTANPRRFLFRTLLPHAPGSKAHPYQTNHLKRKLEGVLAT